MGEQDVIDRITKLAAEAAVAATLETLEKEKKRQHKAKKDWRLRNTKLLLRNYRSFVGHCDDIHVVLDKLNAELLEDLDSDDFAIESIKRSKERTLAMITYVRNMMEVYRILCERSNNQDEMRQYRTIEMMYISDEIFTPDRIADCHKIEVRTVYRDINRACNALSALMFGVDGIRMVD